MFRHSLCLVAMLWVAPAMAQVANGSSAGTPRRTTPIAVGSNGSAVSNSRATRAAPVGPQTSAGLADVYVIPAPMGEAVGVSVDKATDESGVATSVLVIEPPKHHETIALADALAAPPQFDGRGNVLLLSVDGTFARVDADGYLRAAILLAPPVGEPVLENGSVFTAGRDARIYAATPDAILWSWPLEEPAAGGVGVTARRVAVPLVSGHLEWRDRRTGRLLASVALGGVAAAAPTPLPDDRVQVFLDNGEIVEADLNRVCGRSSPAWTDSRWPGRGATAKNGERRLVLGSLLIAIDPEGKERWRSDVRQRILAGPVIADDGTTYVAVTDSEVPPRGALVGVDAMGNSTVRRALPGEPGAWLTLANRTLWVELTDRTLRTFPVPEGAEPVARFPRHRRFRRR